MANMNPPVSHLASTRWQPGCSGNFKGKPKGRLNISTYVRKLLEEERIIYDIGQGQGYDGTPLQAVIRAMIIRAIQGDVRACELVLRHAYAKDMTDHELQQVLPILGGLTK